MQLAEQTGNSVVVCWQSRPKTPLSSICASEEYEFCSCCFHQRHRDNAVGGGVSMVGTGCSRDQQC